MKVKIAGLLGAALLLPAFSVQAVDIQDVALGGLNARFIDLGFTAGTGFDGVKNTVELQLSTSDFTAEPSQAFKDLIYVPVGQGGFGFPTQPPGQYDTLGQVAGLGSLGPGESVNWVYFNFNPAKDLSKLQLVWTGPDWPAGFPVPGAKPINVIIAENGIAAGNQGLFDIAINFGGNGDGALGPDANYSYSKLLFIYDGFNTNIDISDFTGFAAPQGPGNIAAGALVSATGGLSPVAAVPEPSTYAMLGLGLGVLAFAARRRKA